MRSQQKVIKIGNSLGVTLPASFIREGGLRAGEEVILEQDVVYKTIVIKPKKLANKMRLTPEFKEWLDEISEEYEEAIKELAHLK